MANERLLTPSFEDLRQQYLRDIRLGAVDAGMTGVPPTNPGSDWYLKASAAAGIGMIAVTNIRTADDDQNVLTASGDALKKKRDEKGIPPVIPQGATGAIVCQVLGSTVIRDGQRFVYPNGLQGQVVGNYTYSSATYDAQINVKAIDVGTKTNLAAGTVVRFAPAPTNVELEAKVSQTIPLTGGVDEEDTERLRARILNTERNRPAGGNWGQIRQLTLDSFPGVQDCYVYPALGGPGTQKVVPVRKFDRTALSWSRICSPALLNMVRQKLFSNLPIYTGTVVQASADQTADASLLVTIPSSALSGGNGQGWTDQTPWPQLVGADNGRVTVTTSYASGYRIVVSANTSTAPVANQTTIAWWSPADMVFRVALVTTVSGSAGAWDLTLDRILTSSRGTKVAVGDYICPAALNLTRYGSTWLDYLEQLGPGENTSDTGRLPTALRRPLVTDEDLANITGVAFAAFKNNHQEITDISWGYNSTTAPTVPGSADTAPNVLVPRHFGVYLK